MEQSTSTDRLGTSRLPTSKFLRVSLVGVAVATIIIVPVTVIVYFPSKAEKTTATHVTSFTTSNPIIATKIPSHATEKYQSLIIMTFNVQFYKTSKTTSPIATFIIDHHPDVVCLQEDIDSHEWKERKLSPLDLTPNYILVAECRAEKSRDYHLANTIYVHRLHLEHVQKLPAVDLLITDETVRCAAVVRLYDTTIANVHLCGGRFDDKKFRHLQDHKRLQLERLIDQSKPDILVGDFNNENSEVTISQQLTNYQYHRDLTEKDRILFMNYYTSGVRYLRDQTNYVPAYNESSVGVTSTYGGTPDWVYVKDRTRLTGKIDNLDATTPRYSDHNAVIVEYRFAKATAD